MARYIAFLVLFTFFGCKTSSQQLIKPEKFNIEEIKFNSVSKTLVYKISDKNPNLDEIKKILDYWFENKIKVNGFEGTLEVLVEDINISETKKIDYFKFSLEIIVEFKEKKESLQKSKTYKIKASEYGSIEGDFSIKDQENLALNIMYQAINSVSKKLIEIY